MNEGPPGRLVHPHSSSLEVEETELIKRGSTGLTLETHPTWFVMQDVSLTAMLILVPLETKASWLFMIQGRQLVFPHLQSYLMIYQTSQLLLELLPLIVPLLLPPSSLSFMKPYSFHRWISTFSVHFR